MPGLREVEQLVTLGAEESFIGFYDPKKDVTTEPNDKYGTRYGFRFVTTDGRIALIKGGSRLLSDMIDVAGADGQEAMWLKITAHGAAGTFDRTFTVEKAQAPKSK